jgi:hypothetical protein
MGGPGGAMAPLDLCRAILLYLLEKLNSIFVKLEIRSKAHGGFAE